MRIVRSYHVVAALVLILLTLASCLVGVAELRLSDVKTSGLLGFLQTIDWSLFWVSRLPRSLAILLTGSTLAIAGMVLQIVMGNKFIEPTMVGTTQGASLGLLLMTIVFPAAPLMGKMAVAVGCAIAATLLFLQLIKGLSPTDKLLPPLIGIIYASILSGVAIFIAFEQDMLQMLEVWMQGEFSAVLLGRYELLWFSLATAVVAYLSADRLTAVGLGESIATNLGLRYEQIVTLGILLVAVISATVVVTIGSIPFLGLVVPNIVSRLQGDNLRKSLPGVAYLGAALLLICDLLARLLNYPYELPVAMVMGVIGAVLFLSLLLVPTLFIIRRDRHVS